jgi:hypothetical protein
MDDASGDWLESAVITPGKEANYLKNAIGDVGPPSILSTTPTLTVYAVRR